MKNILLSIIIPVYKVELYIRECLDSIYTDANANLPFEVIVVDDGTPDNSMLIVEEFADKYENLKVCYQQNQGCGSARNTGLDVAEGLFVWNVDSDDWIESWAIHRILDLIKKESTLDIIAVPFTWTYPDETKNWIDLKLAHDMLMTGIDYQNSGFQIATSQFVVKRSLLSLNNIRFASHILHEDALWGGEILYLAKKVFVLSQPQLRYRQRIDCSIMHNIRIKNGYDIIKIHQYLMNFMNHYVREEDKIWFQKNHILKFQEAIHLLWRFHKTREFKKFIADTKQYRHKQCDICSKLGDFRWWMKCKMMKYPVLNERLRLWKKYFLIKR